MDRRHRIRAMSLAALTAAFSGRLANILWRGLQVMGYDALNGVRKIDATELRLALRVSKQRLQRPNKMLPEPPHGGADAASHDCCGVG